MRDIHFSRNPKIAGLLHDYEYVREFGEGIDRMYLEMKEAGLPEPEYKTEAFMVYATIRNKKSLAVKNNNSVGSTQENTQDRILEYCKVPRSKSEIAEFLGYKDVKSFGKNHLKPLLASHKLLMTIPDKPTSKNQRYVINIDEI